MLKWMEKLTLKCRDIDDDVGSDVDDEIMSVNDEEL